MCEFGGFIRYADGLLQKSDGLRNTEPYAEEERQIVRETLRGVVYILERLNHLERDLSELIEKENGADN